MQQVVWSKIVWNVINQNVLCYTDSLQNNPNRKHLLAAHRPWRYTNACTIRLNTVPRDGKTEKARKRKLQHSRTTVQLQTSTAAFKVHFCAKRFQNERTCCWRTRAPSHDNISEGLGLSEAVTADLWVWPGLLLKHLPSLSPPLKYRKGVPQGPKCSHLSGQVTHAITPIAKRRGKKKNRSPAAGGNISGEAQRVRGEAGGKSLTCWEFRQKGGVRPRRRRGNGGGRRERKRSVRSRGAATTLLLKRESEGSARRAQLPYPRAPLVNRTMTFFIRACAPWESWRPRFLKKKKMSNSFTIVVVERLSFLLKDKSEATVQRRENERKAGGFFLHSLLW